MANKPLKSITFPGLTDTYTIPQVDSTLTVSGDAADAKAVGDQLTDLKAEIDDLNIVSLNNRKLIHGHMSNAGTWNNTASTSNYAHIVIPVKSGMVLNCAFNRSAILAFVKSYTKAVNGEAIDFSSQSGFTGKVNGLGGRYVVPSDVNYIIFEIYENGSFIVTSLFNLDGYDIDLSALENVGKAFKYHGNMESLGLTTFQDCNKRGDGCYNFSQSYLSSITDKPSDLTSGGFVYYYSNFAGGVALRKVIDSSGNEWFKINQGDWKQTIDVSGKNIVQYRGNMSDLGYTSFQDCNQLGVGYYNFGQSYISSITDKPDNLTSGGFIYYYPNFAGGVALRKVIDSSGNEWFKINQGDWKQTIDVDLKSDTVWYAFGDSITRGLYSVDEDTNAGPTTRNYVYWVSKRNGYSVINYGESGSGYLKKGENNHNAKDLIDSIDFSDCNLVTFAWGVNDWHYNQNIGSLSDSKDLGTTMASNMKYCIEKVLTDNPLCKLIIMLPMNCSKYGGTFESDWGLGTSLTTSGTLQHVIDTIKEIAEYYHLQIIDQSNTSVVNRFNINKCLLDGIHPSVDTYKQIGLNLAKQIQFA